MTLVAATARDLAANREAAQQALVDAMVAPLANTLSGLGYANLAAGTYAECLADSMSVTAIAHLFDLLENDLALLGATAV